MDASDSNIKIWISSSGLTYSGGSHGTGQHLNTTQRT